METTEVSIMWKCLKHKIKITLCGMTELASKQFGIAMNVIAMNGKNR